MTNQDKYEVCEKVKNYLLNLFSFEEYGIPDPSICQIYITIVHPKKPTVYCLTIYTCGKKFFFKEDFEEDIWVLTSSSPDPELHYKYNLTDDPDFIKKSVYKVIIDNVR